MALPQPVLAREADSTASGREQCASDLALAEYGIGCRNAHVGSEEEFVANELGGAVNRGHNWLRSKRRDGAEGVDEIRGVRIERASAQPRRPGRRVDAGREVRTARVENCDPKTVVVVELVKGFA
jgi:hypothetical protein